jgi:hypothetical protein
MIDERLILEASGSIPGAFLLEQTPLSHNFWGAGGLVEQGLKPVASGGGVTGEVVVEEGVNGFDMRQMRLNLLVPMGKPAAHI